MKMPPELKQAIEAAGGGPVDLIDGEKHYVVIPAEDYQRLKEIEAADDWDPATIRQTMAKVMDEDWTDPEMDSFDDTPRT